MVKKSVTYLVAIAIIVFASYTSFVLYELKRTNTYLLKMTEYQANLIELVHQDVQPMKVFGDLAKNRSFSCSVGLLVAP